MVYRYHGLPWRQGQWAIPKHRHTHTNLQGVTSHKTGIFVTATVKTQVLHNIKLFNIWNLLPPTCSVQSIWNHNLYDKHCSHSSLSSSSANIQLCKMNSVFSSEGGLDRWFPPCITNRQNLFRDRRRRRSSNHDHHNQRCRCPHHHNHRRLWRNAELIYRSPNP